MTYSRLALPILGTLALMSSPALAFADSECQIPYPTKLDQSNGWHGWLVTPTDAGACAPNTDCVLGEGGMNGQVTVQSSTRNNVSFTIAWDNGSGGIYTGSVDENGFVSGKTHDRWHPASTADWHFESVASCA